MQKVEEHERGDVAESLYYEAHCRIQDPVYGCVGIITILHEQIYEFQCQLVKVEAEIQAVKARLGHLQPQFP
nr:LOB domain-containing protein 24-like [Ipomoea trifida]